MIGARGAEYIPSNLNPKRRQTPRRSSTIPKVARNMLLSVSTSSVTSTPTTSFQIRLST